MSESSTRQVGTVAKWLNHRGIGFITPDGQDAEVGKDFLVHYSNIKQDPSDGFKSLAEGSQVEFETTEDPKNPNKLIAINVTGVGGGNCDNYRGRRRGPRSENKEEEPGSQVFIGGLTEDCTWREVKDFFQQYGEVKRADVFKKGGFGTVRFFKKASADGAIELANGVEFMGGTLEVRLDKKASP